MLIFRSGLPSIVSFPLPFCAEPHQVCVGREVLTDDGETSATNMTSVRTLFIQAVDSISVEEHQKRSLRIICLGQNAPQPSAAVSLRIYIQDVNETTICLHYFSDPFIRCFANDRALRVGLCQRIGPTGHRLVPWAPTFSRGCNLHFRLVRLFKCNTTMDYLERAHFCNSN